MRDALIKTAGAMILSMVLSASMIPEAYADGIRTYESVPVTLNASACTFDANVPMFMPYYITSDGDAVTSDDVRIENHSIGRIEMKSMKIYADDTALAHDADEEEESAVTVITGSHELPSSGNVRQEELQIIDGNCEKEIGYSIKANKACSEGMHTLRTLVVLGWNR